MEMSMKGDFDRWAERGMVVPKDVALLYGEGTTMLLPVAERPGKFERIGVSLSADQVINLAWCMALGVKLDGTAAEIRKAVKIVVEGRHALRFIDKAGWPSPIRGRE